MKLYVGNLPYTINDEGLKSLFAEAGAVSEAVIITDRDSWLSIVFGFVTFESDEEAKKAIETFNEKDVEGRKIVVNEARPKEERPQRDFGHGGYNR